MEQFNQLSQNGKIVTVLGVMLSMYQRSATPLLLVWFYTWVTTQMWQTKQETMVLENPEVAEMLREQEKIKRNMGRSTRELPARAPIVPTTKELQMNTRAGTMKDYQKTHAFDDELLGTYKSVGKDRSASRIR